MENTDDIIINAEQGYNIIRTFLTNIWRKRKNKFSEEELESFGYMLSGAYGDPAFPGDWLDSINGILNKKITNEDIVTLKLVFDSMIKFCEYYTDFGYSYPNVISLLNSMKANPTQYIVEWNLWEDAIKEVVEGRDPFNH